MAALLRSAAIAVLLRDDIVRMMVGRDLHGMRCRDAVVGEEDVLRVENMTLQHRTRPGDFLVDHVSFRVRKGEVLGIFGLMGAGRTELLECLFGLHAAAASGSVFIDGRRVELRSPADAIANGLALAPEARSRRDGLIMSMSVAENASLASLDRFERFGWYRVAWNRSKYEGLWSGSASRRLSPVNRSAT